jgi:hypothetical protein
MVIFLVAGVPNSGLESILIYSNLFYFGSAILVEDHSQFVW